ncbi:MAG: 2-dehydropantoate 2-reductase N-terminal domain-containing protein [Acidobacteriota bacterium]
MSTGENTMAVLGAGPVGSILAAGLASAGQDVLLIESAPSRAQQLCERGLEVSGTMTMASRSFTILRSLEELRNHKPMALFICTKTWTLKTILPELQKVLHPGTVVVSFQNGIGPEDEVGKFFPPDRVARGTVNYAGGVSPADGTVSLLWFTPPNYLGPLKNAGLPVLDTLAAVMNKAGLTTEVVPTYDVKKLTFFKTILNSALSALCATSGITMRQAMTYVHTKHLADILIREGLSVAAALGYHYGEDAREYCIAYLMRGGDHMPSMWVDLQNKCPTEIEYINGKIAKAGLSFENINVDANVFLTSMVITQEIKSGVRAPDDIPEYLRHF